MSKLVADLEYQVHRARQNRDKAVREDSPERLAKWERALATRRNLYALAKEMEKARRDGA